MNRTQVLLAASLTALWVAGCVRRPPAPGPAETLMETTALRAEGPETPAPEASSPLHLSMPLYGCQPSQQPPFTRLRCDRIELFFLESRLETPASLLEQLVTHYERERPGRGFVREEGEVAPGVASVAIALLEDPDTQGVIGEAFATATQVNLTLSRSVLCSLDGQNRADVSRCAQLSVFLLNRGLPSAFEGWTAP